MVKQNSQSEKTMFYPRSPYAAAKLYAHWVTVTIEKPMECLHVMEFYLITKAL